MEDGRARGTAKTTKPQEAFGKNVDLEISLDAQVLSLPTKPK